MHEQNLLNIKQHQSKQKRKRHIPRTIYLVIVNVLALFGVFVLTLLVLQHYKITNVTGAVDDNSFKFQNIASSVSKIQSQAPVDATKIQTPADLNAQISQLLKARASIMQEYCQVKAISDFAGYNANQMVDVYKQGNSDSVLSKMIFVADQKLQNDEDYLKEKTQCANIDGNTPIEDIQTYIGTPNNNIDIFPWHADEEWAVLVKAISRDNQDILKVADQTDVDPRLIVSMMFVEQNRVANSNRQFFKTVLQPLALLSTGSNLSLGVMNIKPNTAKEIESNLTNPTSQYYPGDKYAHLLDFSTNDPDAERVKRLNDYTHHYYSYLYAALNIKEYEQQWTSAGFNINDRPELLATLFNIGFQHSTPSSNPQVGGAVINIDNTKYTFGSLAYEFYYSGELNEDFPEK